MIERVWLTPVSTKANFARTHADYIAIASAESLITTRTLDGQYGRRWLVTPKGLKVLWSLKQRTA